MQKPQILEPKSLKEIFSLQVPIIHSKKTSLSFLQQYPLKQKLKPTNALSIDHMMSKKSTFIPIGLQTKYKKKDESNTCVQLVKIAGKRQIESHKVNIMNDKSKSSMDYHRRFRVPELKQSKHRKNISVAYKATQLKTSASYIDQTKSFYLKKGEHALRYQLKVDVKKYEGQIRQKNKDKQKLQQEKQQYKRRIKQKLRQQAKNGMQDYQLENNTTDNKSYLLNKDSYLESQKNSNTRNLFGSQDLTESQKSPTRYRRYPVFNFNGRLGTSGRVKDKSIQQPYPWYHHIKNIVNKIQRNDQNTIQFFQNYQLQQNIKNSNMTMQTKRNLKNKSAQCISLCYFDRTQNQIKQIYSKNSHDKVQIASITKIMTCLLIINISKIFNLQIKQEKLLINQKASKMPGTSAQLNYSDTLTIYQALHGLMLPSGNDAAVALGNWGGKMIRKYCKLTKKYSNMKNKQTQSNRLRNNSNNRSMTHNQMIMEQPSYQKLFIYHMNRSARILKLKNTYFMNTHGLMNERAYSTAKDVSKLTAMAMIDPVFSEVVSKKQFQCLIFNRTFSQSSKTKWKNTNKLLKIQGFVGVKTGVTPAAGPCLSSVYNLNPKQSVIIVVLNAKSLENRFKQSLALLKQYLAQHPAVPSNTNNNTFESDKMISDLPLLQLLPSLSQQQNLQAKNMIKHKQIESEQQQPQYQQ